MLHKDFHDKELIKELKSGILLLNNTKEFPWLILVSINEAKNILDLTQNQRDEFWQDINKVAEVVKDLYNPDQINIAMLGNITPQLHCHIIARFKSDSAWPNSTFNFKTTKISEQETKNIKDMVSKLL